MPELRQTSFRAGEWSPTAHGRDDLPAFAHALRRCHGFIVTPHGAAVNRPGTQFLGEAKDHTRRPRLRKFVFSASQTFILEVGHHYLRFWKDGGLVLSGGVPYELATPYDEAHLGQLKFAQSGDIISIAHRSYAPRELRRYGNTNWTLTVADFARPDALDQIDHVPGDTTWANIRYDINLTLTQKPSRYEWMVSRLLKETATGRLIETVPFKFNAGSDYTTGAFSASVHDPTLPQYDSGALYGPANPYANDGSRTWITTHTTPATAGALGNPTDWRRAFVGLKHSILGVNSPAPGTEFDYWGVMFSLPEQQPLLQWTFKAPAAGWTQVGWRLYQGQGSVMGLLVDVETPDLINMFRVDGTLSPDFTKSPPTAENPFVTDWPGTVAYFEQRRIWGGTVLGPSDILGSALADYYNHAPRKFLLDEDAFRFTLASLRYEEIRWLLPLRALLAGTNVGAWVVSGAGGVNDTLTALSVRARLQNYRGASFLDPLVVGNGALVMSPLGNVVQEMEFDFNTDSYQGAELSLLASHLLEGHQIEEWDYARTPYSVAWGVREDGVLLGLTRVRDLEVVAWHWHDTDGAFESICTVEEGTEDAVYVVARRTIGGLPKRYIERFASRRQVTDEKRGLFLDSGLLLDSRNTTTVLTTYDVTPEGYEPEATVAINVSDPTFAASDVGGLIVLDPDGVAQRLEITEVLNDQQVNTRVVETAVPAAFRETPTTNWARTVTHLAGLEHLEGKTVNVVADGNLVEGLVVAGGEVTLPAPAMIVRVGLPYVSDLETLDVSGGDVRGRPKIVTKIRLEVERARGVEAGRDLAHLAAWRQRAVADAWGAIPLFTGDVELVPGGEWAKTGRAAVRQRHPFPVTVLGVTREVELGK